MPMPSKVAPKPIVPAYRIPWFRIFALGIAVQIGFFVAPFLLALFGLGAVFVLAATGGWHGMLAISNFLIGIFALIMLRGWFVPHALAIVVVTMTWLWALQVNLLLDYPWLPIHKGLVLIGTLTPGPIVMLIATFIAYRLPARSARSIKNQNL